PHLVLLARPNAHLWSRIAEALRQPNELLLPRIAGALRQRTANPAILPSSPDIPMLPTWMPGPIAGSAMIPAGTMQITTSTVPGSTDIFQAPLVLPTSIVSEVAAANASALTASSSVLPQPTTPTATTGFGIATTSWSMRTQTISAGTWPTTLGSAPTFTSNFSAARESGRSESSVPGHFSLQV